MRFQAKVVDAQTGEIIREHPWQKNLILDSGLDFVAQSGWTANFAYLAGGTGSNPFSRNSGGTTASITSGTATASAGFFAAADVGRLLKLNSGGEYYITAFTDALHVTVIGPDAAASQCTVWYVNRTALQTQVKIQNGYRVSTGDNITTWTPANKTFTHQRTYLFTAEVGTVSYSELGWAPASTGSLMGGVVLTSPVVVLAGQQLLVVIQVVVAISPTGAPGTAVPNVGTGGWNTSGVAGIDSIRIALDGIDSAWESINSSGVGGGGQPNSPGGVYVTCFLMSGTVTIADPTATLVTWSGGASTIKNLLPQSYTTGSFFRDYLGTFSVNEANGAWNGITTTSTQSGSNNRRSFTVAFTSPQTKDNVHTLAITLRFAYQRILTN